MSMIWQLGPVDPHALPCAKSPLKRNSPDCYGDEPGMRRLRRLQMRYGYWWTALPLGIIGLLVYLAKVWR